MKHWMGLGAIALSVGLALTGCASGNAKSSSSPSASASTATAACKNLSGGSVVDSANVTFSAKKAPTLKVKTPISVSNEQRRVLTKGSGAALPAGSAVSIDAAVFSGTSGKLLQSAGFTDGKSISVTTDASKYLPGLVRSAECLPIGSTAIYAGPVSDALGGVSASQIGISSSEKSLIIVTKVVAKQATQANGKQQSAPSGFPKVTLAAGGTPTIASTKGLTEPKKTKVALLKKGTGATVKKSSTVSVQYVGQIWKSGKIFDSSWQRGAPTSFAVTGTVKGFQKALIGQHVGSQVIVAIPPKDGYGNNPPSGIGKNDTLLFVIDILDAQ